MTREEFIRRNSADWDRLDRFLSVLEKKSTDLASIVAESEFDPADFDRLYRLVCKHLALSRQRLYGVDLVDRLNALALRAHHAFYGGKRTYWREALDFAAGGFPRLVREHRGLMLVSSLLFCVPIVLAVFFTMTDEDFIFSVMSADQVRQLEEMYEPGSRYRFEERKSASDIQMFGFYIWNNVSIDFRTFASGLVFGIGSAFFLLFNGVYFGCIFAHLTKVGYGENLYSFVAGHSAPELIALVISGAAGLNLGYRLVAPGPYGRIEALRRAAHSSVKLVYGAAAMTSFAAFIEAFWSSSSLIPNEVKYVVGILGWLLTVAYLVFAGRRRAT